MRKISILFLVGLIFSCGLEFKKELSPDAKALQALKKNILDCVVFSATDSTNSVTQDLIFLNQVDDVTIKWTTSGANKNAIELFGNKGVVTRFDKDFLARVDYQLIKGTASLSGVLRLNIKKRSDEVRLLAISPAVSTMQVGTTLAFSVVGYPQKTSTVVWSCEGADFDEATLTVKPTVVGEFTLIAKDTQSGVEDRLIVRVSEDAVSLPTTISIEGPTQLEQTQKVQFTAGVEPSNCENNQVVWSIEGESYGSIINPKTGVLTAGLETADDGDTKILVKASGVGLSSTYEVLIAPIAIEGDGYGVAFGSKNLRYEMSKFDEQVKALDSDLNRTLSLTGWKNDRINGKLVIWSGDSDQEVFATPSDLKSGASDFIPAENIKLSYLNYVQASQVVKYIAPYNFYADVLYEDASIKRNIKAKSFQPIWITIDVPKDIAATTYSGNITVKIGLSQYLLKLSVSVLDLTVPDYQDRRFDLQAWIHPQALVHYYSGCFPDAGFALLNGQDTIDDSDHKCSTARGGIELWSDEHFKLYKPVLEELYKSGQRTTVCNITRDPWPNSWARMAGDLYDHQTYYAYDDMIVWKKIGSDEWDWDYTNFEKFVKFAFSCKLNKNLELFGVLPWVADNRHKGELIYIDETDGGKVKRLGLTSFEGDWKNLWTKFFQNFVPYLESHSEGVDAGLTWYDVSRIAVDERNIDALSYVNPILEAVKPAGKNRLRTSAAGSGYHSSVNNTIQYFAYHMGQTKLLYNKVDDEVFKAHAKDRADKGLVTAIYTSTECYPGHFTNSTPAENSFIGWYAAKVGAQGYLRWAIDSWNNARTKADFDPLYSLKNTDNKIFESGDTFSIYPGDREAAVAFIRSSVRHELMKEGFLYYEKIWTLKEQKPAAAAEVDALLSTIVRPTRVAVLSGTGGIQATDYRGDNNLSSFSSITEKLEEEFLAICKKYQ